MDVGESFSSLGRFWESIALLVYIHVALLLLLRYVVGVRFPIRAWIDRASASPRGQDLKKHLEGMQAWSKVPFLLVIGLLFYLVLFNSLVGTVGTSLQLAPFRVNFSEVHSWRDYKPLEEIVAIGSYGKGFRSPYRSPGDEIRLSDVQFLHFNFANEYRARHPDRYESFVGRADERVSDAFYLYNAVLLTLLLLLLGLILSLTKWRRSIRRRQLVGLIAFLLLIGIVIGPIARYRAEVALEARAWQVMFFVVTELGLDEEKADEQMSDSEIGTMETSLQGELCAADDPYPAGIWLARFVDEDPDLSGVFKFAAFAYNFYPRPSGLPRDYVCDEDVNAIYEGGIRGEARPDRAPFCRRITGCEQRPLPATR